MVREYLADASPSEQPTRAIIAPHAGFVFSGAVAGSAFRQLEETSARRVLVMGPSHFVAFNGLALSSHSHFLTPLGSVEVDASMNERLSALDGVVVNDAAHAREHALETHLPFLQEVLDEFTVVPVVVSDASDELVEDVVEMCWDEGMLISISSDLSHFHSYEEAVELDSETARWIEAGEWSELHGQRACGYRPLRGLMRFAAQRKSRFRLLDLRNSGDTAGDRSRVVGYGAFAMVGSDE